MENKINSFSAEPVVGFAGMFYHASFSLPHLTSETGHVQNIAGAALLSTVMKGLGASLPNLGGKWYEIDQHLYEG